MRQLFCVSAIYLVWYHIFYTMELFLYCFPVESTCVLLILVNRYPHHTLVFMCKRHAYRLWFIELPCCAGGRILSWNLTLHGHHCGNNMLSMFTFSTSLRFEYILKRAVGFRYFGMALVHIPCYGLYALLIKAKDQIFSRLFPQAFLRSYY